jgi:hypothetical protein
MWLQIGPGQIFTYIATFRIEIVMTGDGASYRYDIYATGTALELIASGTAPTVDAAVSRASGAIAILSKTAVEQ